MAKDEKVPEAKPLDQGYVVPSEGEGLEEEETLYPKEMIMGASIRHFSQPRWVVDGALAYAKLTDRVNLRVSEVRTAVNEFLAQEDKTHAQALAQQEGR